MSWLTDEVAGIDSSPTARALQTLDLLQRYPGITAADLGRRLGVTDRAARRYVSILRQAEISVDSAPGRYGGYRLGRGLKLPPLVFSSTEALALVMAVLDGHHAADEAGEPVGAALGKIISALPRDVGRQAALMREHALAAPDRRSARPDPEITSQLVEAVADRREVRLDYHPRSGSPRVSVVEPWAVVVRHSHWYPAVLRPAGAGRQDLPRRPDSPPQRGGRPSPHPRTWTRWPGWSSIWAVDASTPPGSASRRRWPTSPRT